MEITEKILNEKGALYFTLGYLTSMYKALKNDDQRNEIANLLNQVKLQYGIENESVNNILKKHYNESNNI
jgi:hypothetical protein